MHGKNIHKIQLITIQLINFLIYPTIIAKKKKKKKIHLDHEFGS